MLLLALVLAGCSSESVATRVGDRTYRIVSPEVPGGAIGPNLRLANQLCPGGFRKLSEQAHKGGEDRAKFDDQNITTIWTVKCI